MSTRRSKLSIKAVFIGNDYKNKSMLAAKYRVELLIGWKVVFSDFKRFFVTISSHGHEHCLYIDS